MRWDLEETKNVIGYNPQDGSPTEVPFLIAAKSAFKAVITSKLPRFFEKHFPHWCKYIGVYFKLSLKPR